jgi:hypothetical protein
MRPKRERQRRPAADHAGYDQVLFRRAAPPPVNIVGIVDTNIMVTSTVVSPSVPATFNTLKGGLADDDPQAP